MHHAKRLTTMIVIIVVPVLGGTGRLSHVNPWGGGVGTLRDGVVHADSSTVYLQTIAVFFRLGE